MKKKTVVQFLLIFSLAALLFLPACGSAENSDQSLQIMMLFDSPVADDSFSHACLKGAEQAKAQYDLTLWFSEAGTDAEAESLLSRISESQAYDLIISIGASQTAALKKLAVKFPKQKFANVDGDISDMANVASLLTRDNESSFLAGALAAMISRNNHIGFVGGREQPSIQRFLAGYQAGAQYINPDCRVSVDYAGSWLNDGKTKMLAVQQILAGADVLYGPAGAGSLGVIEAAREQGMYAVGVDADQSPLAPQTVLVSAVKHINISIFNTIRSVAEDDFQSGLQSSGLKEGAVEAAVNTSLKVITPEMINTLEDLEKKIISGEISVPEN